MRCSRTSCPREREVDGSESVIEAVAATAGDSRARSPLSEPVSDDIADVLPATGLQVAPLEVFRKTAFYFDKRCLSMGTWCTYILSNDPKAPIYIYLFARCRVPRACRLAVAHSARSYAPVAR